MSKLADEYVSWLVDPSDFDKGTPWDDEIPFGALRDDEVFDDDEETKMRSDLKSGVNILKELGRRNTEMTPDFMERKLERHIPVFVYGTLKRGGYFNETLEGLPFLGAACTASPSWDLRSVPGGGFPVMLRSNKGATSFLGKVRGEVYVVDPLTLLQLDRIESNGRMYQREKILVSLFDQKYKTSEGLRPAVIDCWAYIGIPDYFSDGDLVRCPYEPIGNNKFLSFPVGKGTSARN